MTPEDIEQLKQLKQLLDDGVLTAEEFAIQKNLILGAPQKTELANSDIQARSAYTTSNASDTSKKVFETSNGDDKYAVMRDMLASGTLEAKNFSQETLSLVYGKQEDGLSKKEQNSQGVGGSQGTSTTPGLGVADAIRALHASKEANVSGTAASSSGTSKTKTLVLTFTAIILVALVVVVSVIVGGSNDNAKTGDTASKNESIPPSTNFPQGAQISLKTLSSPGDYGGATCVLKIGNRTIGNCSNEGISVEIGEQVSFEVSAQTTYVNCMVLLSTSSETLMFLKESAGSQGMDGKINDSPMSVRCSGIIPK
jgi:hypothetical protein